MVGPGQVGLEPQTARVFHGTILRFTGSGIRRKTFVPPSIVNGKSGMSGEVMAIGGLADFSFPRPSGGGVGDFPSGVFCARNPSAQLIRPAPRIAALRNKFLRDLPIASRLSYIIQSVSEG